MRLYSWTKTASIRLLLGSIKKQAGEPKWKGKQYDSDDVFIRLCKGKVLSGWWLNINNNSVFASGWSAHVHLNVDRVVCSFWVFNWRSLSMNQTSTTVFEYSILVAYMYISICLKKKKKPSHKRQTEVGSVPCLLAFMCSWIFF